VYDDAADRWFASVHILVPGKWTTHKGHHVAADVETDIRGVLSGVAVSTHLEPVDDPLSFEDIQIDR
jgi:divalent metal cation (Fe/Co/Zn/Cd) transporter